MDNNKRDNFKRISENRVSKILVLLSQLTNLTNTSFYEYTDEQMENIFSAIQKELDNQKDEFRKKGKKSKRFQL